MGKNHFPGCQQLLWGPPEDPSQTSSSARASGSGLRGDGVQPSAHTPKPLPWMMPEQRVSNTPRRATHDSQTHLQRTFSPVSCTSFHQQNYSSSGWRLLESSPGPCPVFSTGTTSQALGRVTLIKGSHSLPGEPAGPPGSCGLAGHQPGLWHSLCVSETSPWVPRGDPARPIHRLLHLNDSSFSFSKKQGHKWLVGILPIEVWASDWIPQTWC